LLRRLAHFFSGLLSALAPHWWLGVIGFLSFSAYEITEYVKRHDTLYLEFRDFSTGFYAGLAVRLLLGF